MPELIGRTLGHYRITAAIGAGGMGEVYRATRHEARARRGDQDAPGGVAQDPERLARFEREAALARRAEPSQHRHHLLGRGRRRQPVPRDGAGRGRAASTRSSRRAAFRSRGSSRSRCRSPTRCRRRTSAASCIGTSSPATSWSRAEGRVKVLDFGLAKLEPRTRIPTSRTRRPRAARHLTSEGQVFGTVAYMSPEQTRGGKVDARSDVFSLGIVLYQMADRRAAVPGRERGGHDLLDPARHAASVTDLRADLPPHLARVVRRCLEKDPRDRYQTSRDVHNELRELKSDSSSSPSPAHSRPEPAADAGRSSSGRPAPTRASGSPCSPSSFTARTRASHRWRKG